MKQGRTDVESYDRATDLECFGGMVLCGWSIADWKTVGGLVKC